MELPLKFLEVDEENLRLVMSNRKAAAKSQMSSFGVGDVVIGTVQAVKPYGAFIDVGGINGLLHISQISHDRITNVETVLSEGDKIKVRCAPLGMLCALYLSLRLRRACNLAVRSST